MKGSRWTWKVSLILRNVRVGGCRFLPSPEGCDVLCRKPGSGSRDSIPVLFPPTPRRPVARTQGARPVGSRSEKGKDSSLKSVHYIRTYLLRRTGTFGEHTPRHRNDHYESGRVESDSVGLPPSPSPPHLRLRPLTLSVRHRPRYLPARSRSPPLQGS